MPARKEGRENIHIHEHQETPRENWVCFVRKFFTCSVISYTNMALTGDNAVVCSLNFNDGIVIALPSCLMCFMMTSARNSLV